MKFPCYEKLFFMDGRPGPPGSKNAARPDPARPEMANGRAGPFSFLVQYSIYPCYLHLNM